MNLSLWGWNHIPIDVWNTRLLIGYARTNQKADYASSEYLVENSHELGSLGEWAFGALVGLHSADDIGSFGDDGYDFLTLGVKVDVKATKYYRRPWLKVRVEKVRDDCYYPLIAINERAHAFKYCGYADAKMLRIRGRERIVLRPKHEVTSRQRDEHHGPTSHVVRDRFLLRRGLPPPLKFVG